MVRRSLIGLAAAAMLLSACALRYPASQADEKTPPMMSVASSGAASATGATAASIHDTEDPMTPNADSLEISADGAGPKTVTGRLTVDRTIVFGNLHCCELAASDPPRMLEFFDYDCEYCREHALAHRPWIDAEYVATGKLGIERIFVAMTPAGKRMAMAAMCAAEQRKFSEMDALLLAQPSPTDAQILTFAADIGLNVPSFKDCLPKAYVPEKSYQLANRAITRVPTFIIGADHLWEGILPKSELKKILDEVTRQ